jgi:tRNA A37 threonylcarbamoyladenosine synthetase subunit TsaC/SUA5/YrdC
MTLVERGCEPDMATVQADALQVFRIMKAGGVAVLPLSVSYAIFAHTAHAVERIYELKQRSQSKPNGVIGNWDIFNAVLDTTPRDKDLVRCIIQDHNLPLSLV